MGKLVWNASFYDYDNNGGGVIYASGVGIATPVRAVEQVAEVKPVPAPSCDAKTVEQPGWFNNSGQGMVDAETGTVIRFSRPMRTYYKNQIEACPAPTSTPILPPDAGTVVSTTTK